MISAYYTLTVSGKDHDKDRITSFHGIKYDHSGKLSFDGIHYCMENGSLQSEAGESVTECEMAAHINQWFSEACYYFSPRSERNKHFLRAMFYYNYFDPYGHERAGSQNKLVDILDVIRLNTFLGEPTLEIPISPLGEEVGGLSRLMKHQCSNDCLSFMIEQMERTLAQGARAFSLIKSHSEKRALLSQGIPLVHLRRIPNEMGLMPKVIMPFASSESNKNRSYVYDLQSDVQDVIKSIIGMLDGVSRHPLDITPDMSHGNAYYLDANKGDLLISLSDLPMAWRGKMFNEKLVVEKTRGRASITDMIKKMGLVGDFEKNFKKEGVEGTFYAVRINRHRVSRGVAIKKAILGGQAREAITLILKDKDQNSEIIRLGQFLTRNNMDESIYTSEIDAIPYVA